MEGGDVTVEAEGDKAVSEPWGREPRNVGGPWTLEAAESRFFSPWKLQKKHRAADTLILDF